MYYYIISDRKIHLENTAVNTAVFPQYVEMTPAQVEFYLENKDASIEEIKNCQLNVLNDDFDLAKTRETFIDDLSRYSLYSSLQVVPEYKLQNALLDKMLNVENKFYSNDVMNTILERANTVGQQCRALFYEMRDELNNINTREELYTYYATCKQRFDIIVNSYK